MTWAMTWACRAGWLVLAAGVLGTLWGAVDKVQTARHERLSAVTVDPCGGVLCDRTREDQRAAARAASVAPPAPHRAFLDAGR